MFTNSLNVISFDKTITIRTFLESCMILKVNILAFVLNFNFDRHILNIPTMTFSPKYHLRVCASKIVCLNKHLF